MNYRIRGNEEIARELERAECFGDGGRMLRLLDRFAYDILPVDKDTVKVDIRFDDELLGRTGVSAIFTGRQLFCYGSLGTYVFEDVQDPITLSGLSYASPWLIEDMLTLRPSGELSGAQRRGKLWLYIQSSPWYGRLDEERKSRLTDFLRGGEEKVLPGDVLFEEKAAVELIAKLMRLAEDTADWMVYFQCEMLTREQFLFGTIFAGDEDDADCDRHSIINRLYRNCLNYGGELYVVVYLLSAAAAAEAEQSRERGN